MFRTTTCWLIIACLLFVCGGTLRAQRVANSRLSIEDIRTMSSHEQLLEAATQRAEQLASLLAQIDSAAAARTVCPALERAYLEMELLGVRATMLGTPAPAQVDRLRPAVERFEQARTRLAQECARVRKDAVLAAPVRSVVEPVHAQLRGLAMAKERSLAAVLQMVRSQLELYKLQHRDVPPDFRTQGWSQLTGRTNDSGEVRPDGRLGPYLNAPPVNPLNGSSRILIVRKQPEAGFRYRQADCGFIYDERSGRLWALDQDGAMFDEHSLHTRGD